MIWVNANVAGSIGVPGATTASAMNNELVDATQMRTRSLLMDRVIATSIGCVPFVSVHAATLAQVPPNGLRYKPFVVPATSCVLSAGSPVTRYVACPRSESAGTPGAGPSPVSTDQVPPVAGPFAVKRPMPRSFVPGRPPCRPDGAPPPSSGSPVPTQTSSSFVPVAASAAPQMTCTDPHASALATWPTLPRSDAAKSSSGRQVSPRSGENHTPPPALAA